MKIKTTRKLETLVTIGCYILVGVIGLIIGSMAAIMLR